MVILQQIQPFVNELQLIANNKEMQSTECSVTILKINISVKIPLPFSNRYYFSKFTFIDLNVCLLCFFVELLTYMYPRTSSLNTG